MNYMLTDICSISSGQTFRTKVESEVDGDISVIQMKDVNENCTGVSAKLSKVSSHLISDRQLLQQGDVLFIARGNKNRAFVFEGESKTVAVSLFFVLRADKNLLNPHYLAWYLNQPKTQSILRSSQEGATVASIKKRTLEDLLIQTPEIEEQQKVAKLYALMLREESLLDELKEKRKKLINTLLIEKIS